MTGGCLCGAVRLRTDGELSQYEHRSDESGRWIRLHFCHAWTRSRQRWFSLPAGAVTFEKSSGA